MNEMSTEPIAPTETSSDSETHPTAASGNGPAGQRRAVIEALATNAEPMTIQQVERAVGRLLADGVRDAVEDSVESLIQEGQVEHAPGDARRLRLTERGSRFAKGIQALAAG
jgi:hypothetical protein